MRYRLKTTIFFFRPFSLRKSVHAQQIAEVRSIKHMEYSGPVACLFSVVCVAQGWRANARKFGR
jgi:hypothetical protein